MRFNLKCMYSSLQKSFQGLSVNYLNLKLMALLDMKEDKSVVHMQTKTIGDYEDTGKMLIFVSNYYNKAFYAGYKQLTCDHTICILDRRNGLQRRLNKFLRQDHKKW